MDYCGERGIPLGWFLGGRYEWDDFSRDAALAWDHDRRLRCSTCNEYDDEWRDAKGLRLEGRRAPKVVTEYVCPGCAAIELHHNADENKERTPGAKTILITRRMAARTSPRRRSKRSRSKRDDPRDG
jgi:hypothetical protein